MTARIYITGIIGQNKDCSLLDVVRQFKSYDSPTSIEVIINSIGGEVTEGQSIFLFLRNTGLPITTIADGDCASIATVIYLAGDTRIAYKEGSPFLLHLPWAKVEGNSIALDGYLAQLKEVETEMLNFYSKYLNIDKDTIKGLLAKESFLTPEEAQGIGLVTEIREQLKAVAMFDNSENFKNDNKIMTKIEKFINAMQSVFAPKDSADIVALVLQDANGSNIDFPELAEGDTPAVGDKAVIDDKPAEGEIMMPSGETYAFEAGELKEIKPAEVDESEEEAADPVEENAQIVALFKDLEGHINAKMEKMVADIKAEQVAMRKLMGSDEIQIQARANQVKQRPRRTSYLR